MGLSTEEMKWKTIRANKYFQVCLSDITLKDISTMTIVIKFVSPYVPRCLQLCLLVHHQGLHTSVEVNGTEAATPGNRRSFQFQKSFQFSQCCFWMPNSICKTNKRRFVGIFPVFSCLFCGRPAGGVYIGVPVQSKAVFTHLRSTIEDKSHFHQIICGF